MSGKAQFRSWFKCVHVLSDIGKSKTEESDRAGVRGYGPLDIQRIITAGGRGGGLLTVIMTTTGGWTIHES